MTSRTRLITEAAVLTAIMLLACTTAAGQQSSDSRELDVTMQIIVDPEAKSTDEVVRRIALPALRTPDAAPTNDKQPKTDAEQKKGQDRAREARQSGREMSQEARDNAHEAAEQREQARRAAAEERKRREPPSPRPPPERPPHP